MDVFGYIAFGISVVLAVVKFWETFFQKPKLDMDFVWRYDSANEEHPHELRIAVANVGRRKSSVRAIGFAPDPKKDHLSAASESINKELPKILDINECVSFVMGLHPGHGHPVHRLFHQNLVNGKIKWAYVQDARRELHWFRLPSPDVPGETSV